MRTEYMAIGLAAVVSVVPASFAQDSRVVDHGKSAGTEIEAEKRQTHQRSREQYGHLSCCTDWQGLGGS